METSWAFDRCAENCVPDRCAFGRGEECAMWHDPKLEGKPPPYPKPYVPCLASEFGKGTCFQVHGHEGGHSWS